MERSRVLGAMLIKGASAGSGPVDPVVVGQESHTQSVIKGAESCPDECEMSMCDTSSETWPFPPSLRKSVTSAPAHQSWAIAILGGIAGDDFDAAWCEDASTVGRRVVHLKRLGKGLIVQQSSAWTPSGRTESCSLDIMRRVGESDPLSRDGELSGPPWHLFRLRCITDILCFPFLWDFMTRTGKNKLKDVHHFSLTSSTLQPFGFAPAADGSGRM
ncbi:hypothetical protein EYF80_032029 [Liparis tanakae]|uniref:Uncharacterized protein n=1 Tax=Liparis tanakae TaxID=230148 RepID=A0A4Z2GWT5_9TELE|nr:hypothetical protein EYF80_032029 [Liparis tanakae]